MLAKIMKSNLEGLLDLPGDIVARVVQQGAVFSLAEIMVIFNAVTSTQDMAKKTGSFRIPLEVMIIKLTQPLNENAVAVEIESTKKQAKPAVNEDAPMPEPAASSPARKFASKIKLDNIGSLFIGPTKKQEENAADNAHENPAKDANPPAAIPPATAAGNDAEPLTAKSVAELNFETVFNNWDKLVEDVALRKMSVGTYLRNSRPLRLEDGVLTIGFPKRSVFYKEAVEQQHNQKIIKDQLKTAFNAMLGLRLELFEEGTEKEKKQDQDSEYLKSVLDTFNGRLFERGL